ncbi:MAG: sigma factor-like helix-turn-helix DNA-binding protein [Oscillospiraceae bacterium]|jgi:predicted DNA-binding protein YlxM (UPF0122 family)
MENKTLQMTMLLDFYGELLTPKQRRAVTLRYDDDFSLAEIAEDMGITRQGARDLLVRAEATLIETEQKTGIVRRFTEQREELDRMDGQLRQLISMTDGPARELGEKLLSELSAIRD